MNFKYKIQIKCSQLKVNFHITQVSSELMPCFEHKITYKLYPHSISLHIPESQVLIIKASIEKYLVESAIYKKLKPILEQEILLLVPLTVLYIKRRVLQCSYCTKAIKICGSYIWINSFVCKAAVFK